MTTKENEENKQKNESKQFTELSDEELKQVTGGAIDMSTLR